MINDYASLSSRAGFNKSLGHFRLVTSIVGQLDQGKNLADIVDDLEKKKGLEKSQITPLLNAVIVDRMNYQSASLNLLTDTTDFGGIADETNKWNRVDIILAYHHPQLGVTLINPKEKASWGAVQEFDREELVVCYVKGIREKDADVVPEVLQKLKSFLSGENITGIAKFNDPTLKKAAPPAAPSKSTAPAGAPPAAPPSAPKTTAAPQAAPPPGSKTRLPGSPPAAPSGSTGRAKKAGAPKQEAAAPSSGGKKTVTPKYSVQVTNELFHNGNVEAWKNIIESYKVKFPGIEVYIFHDGQKVNNINALFKWGKVKNGDVILFSCAGESIKGIAKLQRYLFEGASLRYETFLKKDVNKVLNLF